MTLKESYLRHILSVRRYSPRTAEIYSDVLDRFAEFACEGDSSDDALVKALTPQTMRSYEVFLMDEKEVSPRTVSQHLSVMSGFCRFLMQNGRLSSNPVRLVSRPKVSKRLPEVLRPETVSKYLSDTASYATPEGLSTILGRDATSLSVWTSCRDRLVIHILYDTGLRRAELISLCRNQFDSSRQVLHVLGKGGKMREIPLLPSLCEEILLYLHATDVVGIAPVGGDSPLLVTAKGGSLYPMAVERIVRQAFAGTVGKKSPHVLRHSLATALLDEGTGLNAIKELLGHSSLAATQVYTHNSVEKLRQTYRAAHPRAGRDKNE